MEHQFTNEDRRIVIQLEEDKKKVALSRGDAHTTYTDPLMSPFNMLQSM